MNIQLVKTAFKVGFLVLKDDSSQNKIKVIWDEQVSSELLKDESGRVYLIVVNNIIKKIGGSVAKNGIKGTWSAYCSGFTGSPSVRTFGIHMLIKEELEKNNVVEIYLINSEMVQAPVKGLFGSEIRKVSYDFKEMEKKCKEDYFELTGDYPPWNFQEKNMAWPIHIQEACNELNNKTTKKSKK
jgi:hypothetical protein